MNIARNILIIIIFPLTANAENSSKFSGSIDLGAQYQTNAIFGTDSRTIRILGEDFPRDPSLAPVEDYNAFINGFLKYDRTLGENDDTALDVLINGTGLRYDKNDNLNYTSFNGQFGLDFKNALILADSLKPFILLSTGKSGSGSYSYRYGTGISFQKKITNKFLLFGSFTYEENKIDNKLSEDIQIEKYYINLTGLLLLNLKHSINVSLYLNEYQSRDEFNDYLGVNISAGYNYYYTIPIVKNTKCFLNFRVLYIDNNYDNAKNIIDPNIIREDKRWNFYVTNTIPITNKWSFSQSLRYTEAESNLPNFRYDNFGISLSIRRSFR